MFANPEAYMGSRSVGPDYRVTVKVDLGEMDFTGKRTYRGVGTRVEKLFKDGFQSTIFGSKNGTEVTLSESPSPGPFDLRDKAGKGGSNGGIF